MTAKLLLKAYSTRALVYFFVAFSLPITAFYSNLTYFQTNDDFTQMLITSGILYGSPSSQLLYLAKPLSIFISQLYLFSLNYSWYTIVLLASQGLAIFAYFLLIDQIKEIKNFYHKIQSVLLLLSPILIFLIMFFSLQYTQTAMMAAATGALLILYGKNRFEYFLAPILMTLGLFWRAEAALMATTVVIVFYITNWALEGGFKYSKIRKERLFFISLISILSYLIFLAGFHERSPFISNEKKIAISYYKSLGKVLDYSPTTSTKDTLNQNARKVGWSKNDFRLLNKFYFANKEIYTEDRNLKLSDISSPASNLKFFLQVSKKLNKIIFLNHKRILIFVLFFLLISFFTFKPKRFFHIFVYLSLLYSILIFILSLGRIPERVLWPLIFVVLISLSITLLKSNTQDIDRNNRNSFLQYSTPLALSGFYILIFMNLYDQYLKIDEERWWKIAKQEKIYGFEKVLEYEPEKPIIAFSSFYSVLMKTHSPTKPPSQTEEIWRNMILIGWTIRSPELDKKIHTLGLSDDLFTSILNKDAYLATSDHLTEVAYLNRYFRQHRYAKADWGKGPFVFNETGLGIWQIDSFEPIELPE